MWEGLLIPDGNRGMDDTPRGPWPNLDPLLVATPLGSVL